MEENKVVEMEANETEEVTEMKESKEKGFIEKIGSGVKRHWKPIAIGAGAFIVGCLVGSRKTEAGDCDMEDDPAVMFEEVEVNDNSEE